MTLNTLRKVFAVLLLGSSIGTVLWILDRNYRYRSLAVKSIQISDPRGSVTIMKMGKPEEPKIARTTRMTAAERSPCPRVWKGEFVDFLHDGGKVERLLRAIYRPHNVHCIHVDAKASKSFRQRVALIARCLPNVFLSNSSVSVHWGTFSTLEAELVCLRQLWAQGTKWRYYINLTGQEFPLKTNRQLVQILTAFQGANDIGGDETLNTQRWKGLPPPPYNLRVYKGSVHVAATRGFVDYVLHSNVSRQLVAWLRQGVIIPDEVFYNTLNHNPHLGVPGSVNGHQNYRERDSFTRHKVWAKSHKACAGRFVRHICHFGVGDLPRLMRSPSLFANKFSYHFQPLAYDCLEEWLSVKVRMEEEEKVSNSSTWNFSEWSSLGSSSDNSSRSSLVHSSQSSGSSSPVRHIVATSSLNLTVYEESLLVKNRYEGPVKIW